VNLEADVIAKYVERILNSQARVSNSGTAGI
jgi:riboflavin synthase alpha subunit